MAKPSGRDGGQENEREHHSDNEKETVVIYQTLPLADRSPWLLGLGVFSVPLQRA
jgi:hypothetical protein